MAQKTIKQRIKGVYADYISRLRGHAGLGLPGADGLLRARNARINQEILMTKDGYLIDQAAGTEGTFRYGITRTADTGCEIIAVYNLLLKCGKKPDMQKLLKKFESGSRGRIAYGKLGTSIWGMVSCLKEYGIAVRDVREQEVFDAALTSSGAGILTFWWSSGSWRIHTVMVEKNPKGKGITVYNYDPWHGRGRVSAPSLDVLIRREGLQPIAFLPVMGPEAKQE